jgi:methyltransferase-like protein
VYFRDFACEAARAGLHYLGDAHLWTMMPDRLGAAAADAIAKRSRGLVDTEQLIDYLDLRFFRRSLLCQREVALERRLSWPRLRGLWLRAGLRPLSAAPEVRSGREEAFAMERGTELSTSSPQLKAALSALAAAYPAGVRFEDLCAQAEAAAGANAGEEEPGRLGKNLLGLVTRGEIALDAWRRPCAASPPERPETTALARLEAARGREACTTLLHERAAVDAFDRALLSRMDGTRTREGLAAGAAEEIAAGRLEVCVEGTPRADAEALAEITEEKLRRLARAGLILG